MYCGDVVEGVGGCVDEEAAGGEDHYVNARAGGKIHSCNRKNTQAHIQTNRHTNKHPHTCTRRRTCAACCCTLRRTHRRPSTCGCPAWRVMRHTSHVTRHTSHITRHTSHLIRHRRNLVRHLHRHQPVTVAQGLYIDVLTTIMLHTHYTLWLFPFSS